MQIISFSVIELFNSFSYHFEIDEDQKVFMLTGPNGYGKTTILTIINNLSKLNLEYFYELPFKSIEINFEEEQRLTIESVFFKNEQMNFIVAEDNEVDIEKEVAFRWFEKKKEITKLVLNKKNLNKAHRSYNYEHYYRESFQLLSNTKEYRNGNDLMQKYAIIAKEQNQEQFLLILKSISTLFLPANRIYVNKRNEDKESNAEVMIYKVAESLKKKMQETFLNYFRQSDKGSKELIEKLLESDKKYTREEYEEKAVSLKNKLIALKSFNLYVDKDIRPYQEDKKQILSVYLDELANKIEVYTELAKRLTLFSSLLENKKFINKKVVFNRSSGLRAISNDGSILELDKLSSGEQNEIIMLYHFIFEINEGMIVLIDEPENSLHVAWQSMFLNDIKQIAEGIDVQFIIATHSPQLIGNNWDKCFDLYECLEA